MFDFETLAQSAGEFLDIVGVLAILAGVVLATIVTLARVFEGKNVQGLYRSYRYGLARSILIGLEFLVAGDIIRTVAGDLQLDGLLELGLIVLIRIMVSLEFEVGIEGRWPWKRAGVEEKKVAKP